ncbi:MAG: ATP-dependent DNA helicase [Solirubrobacteraceae bacterium]
MANALDGLTDSQREAVTHGVGPLVLIGGPGTGKTEVLARRVCWLSEQGLAAHRPLVIPRDGAAAGGIVERIEQVLNAPHEQLSVLATHAVAAQVIGEHAAAAGVAELAVVATAAERLALLLDHADQVELRHHDFRGRPLVLFASFIRQIDALKAELIGSADYTNWARDGGERELEFAALFALHDRILAERGLLDDGELLIAAVGLLERDRALAAAFAERHQHLLVDDWQCRSLAERELVRLIVAGGAALTAAGDEDQALSPQVSSMTALAERCAPATVVTLAQSFRCPQRILDAGAAVLGGGAAEVVGASGGDVRFWRCRGERAQAQHVAAELERLIVHQGVSAGRCAVLVRSVAGEGQLVAAALSERSVAHRLIGTDAFFERAEVRDVLAWLRLLVDPRDAAAVVRALSRPPIELHSVDIARCVQIARRRKLDMVGALAAALAAPTLVPEARERIASFLTIQRAAAAALDDERADLFVHRLIERLGLRRRQLFSADPDVVERLVNLAKLSELAGRHTRAQPSATPREFAAYITVVAESGIGEAEAVLDDSADAVLVASVADAGGLEFDHVFVLSLDGAWGARARRRSAPRSPRESAPLPDASEETAMRRVLYVALTRARESLVLSSATGHGADGSGTTAASLLEEMRVALGGEWEDRQEELFGPAEALHSLFRERRDELLGSVGRVGAQLGELRLDTDLDVAHAVVRLLELVKLAALLERREEQPIADALSDINARLAAAATPLQREILLSSPLDELLAGTEQATGLRAARSGAREEPSLARFLPRRGDGLVLSASDIDTFRACPLRYKFARVLRVPREPTLNQRFGILVHQVLERFHEQATHGPLARGAEVSDGRSEMLRLLDAAWRRSGLSDSDEERQLREKARNALLLYQQRLGEQVGVPRWFERSFSFSLGHHQLRGRVDRIDELPGGGHGLIDYKTGLPRRAEQLRDDVQLALYAVAARETWQLEATERTYYYVLDDERVSLGPDEAGLEWVSQTVAQVADGILAQRFEPTPSRAVCAMCDYRIACPAVEK